MAKKNLCGIEIEFSEDKEFHDGMFHCYGATRVGDRADPNDTANNFVTIEFGNAKHVKIIAMCPSFVDAKAIVCAMGIAKKLMDGKVVSVVEGVKDVLKDVKSEMNERLLKVGYNIEAMEAKMDELIKSGKSSDEILKYMNEHREDFIVKKPDNKTTDDSKERW